MRWTSSVFANEMDSTISPTFQCEKAGKNTATVKYPG